MRYVRFYRFVNTVSHQVTLVSFEEVTENFDRTLDRVEATSSLSFNYKSKDELEAHVKEHIKKHWDSARLPLPSQRREEIKEQVRERLLQEADYPQAEHAYRLMQKAHAVQVA